MGVFAGASTARGGFVGQQCSARLDSHGQRRLRQGWHKGHQDPCSPWRLWGFGAQVHWHLHSQRSLWRRQGLGPGPSWPEEALLGLHAGCWDLRGPWGPPVAGGQCSGHWRSRGQRRTCLGWQMRRWDPRGLWKPWGVAVLRSTGTCLGRGALAGVGLRPRSHATGGLSGVVGGPLRPMWPWEALAFGGPRPRTCLAREALSAVGLSPRTSRLAWAFEGWASLLRCAPLPLPKETGPADGEGHNSGGPALCVPLNHGTPLPWLPEPPPPTFLAMEPLPPAATDHLLTANSHPLPGSTLQTPLSCTQPSSPPGGTQPRLGCAGPWQVPCAQASLRPTPHRPVAKLSSDPLKVPLCPC